MLPYIMGMILSVMMILLNEPLAKLSAMIYRRALGINIENKIMYRTKLSFIIYGTLFMVINAMILRSMLPYL